MTSLIQIFGTGIKTAGARVYQAFPPGLAGERQIAAFAFEGTGQPAGTIALFGHAFPRGAIQTTDSVLLRRSDDGGAALRTQMNVLSQWPDNSVKTALLAAELPSLADQQTLAATLQVGADHPDPGPALSFATALSGRSATIQLFNPSDAASPAWTFDPLAAIGTDRWHEGPLALSTRVETAVPSTHVGCTSLRLVVDVTVTKDGTLWLDVCWSNDRVFHSGGGDASFGYAVLIDGVTVYSQKPAPTAAAATLKQYGRWIRRRGRRSDGTLLGHAPGAEPAYFRPDFDVLVQSGLTLNFDRTAEIDESAVGWGWVNAYNAGVGQEGDPYWNWGIERSAGAVGGRPEIGYRTFPNMIRLTRPIDRRAHYVSERQVEAVATRPMFFAAWNEDYNDVPDRSWVNPQDWPLLALGTAAEAGNPPADAPGTARTTARGLPSAQRANRNSTDHLTVDHSHHGEHFWTSALLSGRRVSYDALAAKAMWSVMDWNDRANGALYTSTPEWRTLTVSHETGIGWGSRPWAPQARAAAWDWRDIVDAASTLPDAWARREVYTRAAEAICNAWDAVASQIEARHGSLGTPLVHANGGHTPGFMFSFAFYGLLTMRAAGLGGAKRDDLIRRLATFRTGSFLHPDFNYRNALAGIDIYIRDGSTDYNTWAQVQARQVAEGRDLSETWGGTPTEGGWQRDVVSGLAILTDVTETDALPLTLQADAADALVLARSERKNTNDMPRLQPVAFFGQFSNTAGVNSPRLSWRWDSAPAILPGQSFNVVGDALPGTIIGIVRTTGPVPRNSATGRGVNDAFVIVSQPEGNPFSISQGGVLRVVGSAPHGPQTVQVYCRTYEQEFKTDPNTEHRSATVAVTVNVSLVAPYIEPAGPIDVLETREVGYQVIQLTVTGNAPSLSIVAGDPTGRFAVTPVTARTAWITVAASLSGLAGTPFTLTLRATNAAGSFDRNVTVQVVSDATAPVITAGQTFTMFETAAAGQATDPETVAYTGSPPTAASITAGNTDNRLAIALAGGDVRLSSAAMIHRPSYASFTPTVRLSNAAGADEKPVTVNIVQPTVFRTALPNVVFTSFWSVARRVYDTYTGPLFRVRRGGDNAEQDIYATASGGHYVADEDALTAFVGTSDWWIVRIYDQGLLAQHLQQSSTSLQPVGGSAGAIQRIGANNRLAISFGSGRRLAALGASILPGSGNGIGIVSMVRTGSDIAATQRIAAAGGGLQLESQALRFFVGGNGVNSPSTASANTAYAVLGRWQSTAPRLHVRGTPTLGNATATSFNSVTSPADIHLGATGTGANPWLGRISEFVLTRQMLAGAEEATMLDEMWAFYGA